MLINSALFYHLLGFLVVGSSNASLSNEQSNSDLTVIQETKELEIKVIEDSSIHLKKDYLHESILSHSKEIIESPAEACKDTPVGSNKINVRKFKLFKGENDYSVSLRDVYNKIIDKLNSLQEKRIELNFYSNDFLEKLALIIKNIKTKFSIMHLLWADIGKLLFKHFIYLKGKMIKATNEEFEKVSKSIQSIVSMIDRNVNPIITYNFDFKTMNIKNFNSDLLKSEFFEQSDELAPRFAAALEYFYSPIISEEIEKGEIKEITCEKFKMEFFENGNSDNDILLQFFMDKYDSRGKLIRLCLESNIQPDYSKISKESINKIKNDIIELRSKGVLHFTKIPSILYATNSVMRFILSNNEKVFISDEISLYQFLQRMEEAELLKKENIESLFEFENDLFKWNSKQSDNVFSKWDPKKFESFLLDYGRHPSTNIDQRELFNKCLSLFNMELL